MYDNIAALRFQQGPNGETLASAMISAEGEVMEFRENVPAEGRVEDWMTSVLEEMRCTNRLITKEAIFFYCADGKTRSGLNINDVHVFICWLKIYCMKWFDGY